LSPERLYYDGLNAGLMRVEGYLVLGAVALVVVAGAVALLVSESSVVGEETEVEEGEVSIINVDLTPRNVSAANVELGVVTRLGHEGGVSENVSVVVRVVDSETGMLEDERGTDIGRLEGDTEADGVVNISVVRDRDYDLRVLVYKDGRRVEGTENRLRGLEDLGSEEVVSEIDFHSFEEQPPVEFSVERVVDGNAVLNARAYLTNYGNRPSENVEVTIKARQTDTEIVADENTSEISEIGSGETERGEVLLSVPDGFNYHLDAVVWSDGSIVETHRNVATLNPDVNRSNRSNANTELFQENRELRQTIEELESENNQLRDPLGQAESSEPEDDETQEEGEADEEANPSGIPSSLLVLGIVGVVGILGAIFVLKKKGEQE